MLSALAGWWDGEHVYAGGGGGGLCTHRKGIVPESYCRTEP